MTLAARSGADTPARRAATRSLLQRLRQGGIDTVRVAWCDLHGTLRGKTLICGPDAQPVADALDDGIGMVSTVMLKDTSDRTAFHVFDPEQRAALAALPGFGSANNLLLLPDPASFVELPWAAGTGWLRAEPLWADGTPVPADPRGVLLRALAALADAGYALRCGLEIEFHIYRITDDNLLPERAAWPAEPPAVRLVHPGYQLLAEAHADLADEPLAIVRRTALGLGLPLRSLEIELGPSQVEAVFGATDALTAADQMALFRSAVRQALRRAGYHATFVCRPPLPHAIASGWHLHQSLIGVGDAGGANAMARAVASSGVQGARQVLSDAGTHWLAGLLAHAPGLVALSSPTIPAYTRYQGSVMAPQAAVWARDNRGAMLRVIGTVGEPGDTATRLENRLGEPMANPYLMIAAQILAGLDGLARRLEPGPATEAPYALGVAGAPALPASLGVALDALREDAVLQQGLGGAMATVYDTVKRQELARHAQAEDRAAWERCEYFGRF